MFPSPFGRGGLVFAQCRGEGLVIGKLVIGHYLVIVSCILVIDLVSSFVTFLCIKTEKSKNKQFGQIRKNLEETFSLLFSVISNKSQIPMI
jgi:hypothetical protein